MDYNQAIFITQAPGQVEKISSKPKKSKASGQDNLDTYILKLTKKEPWQQYNS